MNNVTAEAKQPTTTLTDRRRNLIFLNIVVSCIASSLLSTALTTALPSIMEDLSISATTGQWLTSGYSLAMGIMMPLTAFLIRRFSTRRLYICSLLLFLAGLFLNAVAPSFPVMMIARVLQASGNGIMSAMAQVIILTIYPPQKRGTAMGWYGLSIGAAPVIAPTLAGLIVDSIGWRAIFFISIAIIFASLIWSLSVFTDVLETSVSSFDTVSFLLSVFAFGGVTLGIGNIGSYPFLSLPVLGILTVGLAAAFCFVIRQLHLETPFLELRILKSRQYALSVIGSVFLYLVMMGASMLMPLYIQNTMGYSATVSGLAVLPGSLVMAIISPFAGKFYDRLGMKKLFMAGSLCMFLSNLGMVFIGPDTSLLPAVLLNALRNLSIGCLLMSLVTWGNSGIPKEKIADGTALLTSLRTIAGAIGTAVFVGIMNAVTRSASATLPAKEASMRGVNISFLCMSAVSLILVLIAVFGVKKTGDDR